MRALVLSGGGMFGAYQAGAWSALEDVFRPDLVVGCSVGALNGWLIASGCPAAEMEKQWLSMPAMARHRWRVPPGPLDGFIDPTPFEQQVRTLHHTWRPKMPVAVVATELARLRPRIFRETEIGWEHLAASCAVFGALPQYRIDGRRYSDGGLLGALPLWAALELGATSIVAVQVMPRMPWPLRAGLRMLRAWSGLRTTAAADVPVFTIAPRVPLGSLREAAFWDRGRAERWLAQGRHDAEEVASNISRMVCFGSPVPTHGHVSHLPVEG